MFDFSSEELEAIRAVADAANQLRIANEQLTRLLDQRFDEVRWIAPREAAQKIGGISERWLLHRIRSGGFKYGREYVDTSNGDRPHYLVNIAAVHRYLQTPPEKRSPSCRDRRTSQK